MNVEIRCLTGRGIEDILSGDEADEERVESGRRVWER